MDTTGLIVVAAVLALGAAVGWWRRRTDGRLRPAAAVSAGQLRPAAAASPGRVGGAARDQGEPATGGAAKAGAEAADSSAAGERIDPTLLRELGVQPAPATLLQFSTAFCAPCRALRRISAEVAGLLPGVQHIDVDAESHLGAVRALGIWRTPTLLVLDADGRVTRRATGVPGKPQLIAALGEILPPA